MKNEKEAMIIVLNLFLNLQMQKRKLNPTKNQNIYIWLNIYLPNLSICTNIYFNQEPLYLLWSYLREGVVSIIVFYFWFYMYHKTFTEEEKLYFVPLESLIAKY